MLVACFVLIGNSYFNVNNIVSIRDIFGGVEITSNSGYRRLYIKETSKEVVNRINKECSKK